MSKKFLYISVILSLILASCAGKPGTAATSATSSADSSSSDASSSASSSHLGDALNKVIGSDSDPSVFDSYHIDVKMDVPKLSDDSTSVVNETTQISADVQGKNVHIFQTDPGQTAQKEGFIIGDKEYKIVDGAPQEMLGQIALSWAMWPLTVIMAYSYPAYYAKKTGTESNDGRAVDVYTFDSTSANAVSNDVMSAASLGNSTQGKGTVWIDQKTGAMLKLDMTYTSQISDNNQKVIGSGNGSIKIEISKVGQVTVTSPVK
jgi:hypothetical protein